MRVFAATAILPAAATLFFAIFWSGFDFWRRHRWLTYGMILGTLAAVAAAVFGCRDAVYATRIEIPTWLTIIGYSIVTVACVFAFVADRQIGFRVRSFAPFFDHRGRIALKTSGAFGVVRHPIYAAGIWYQLGAFLVTGFAAVAVACAVFTAGAVWFTRQEERRLVELLDDPAEYERYRQQVPALIPFTKRRRPRSTV